MKIRNKLLRNKAVRQTIRLLRQGTSPHKMALTITLGFLLGIIPAFGFITPVCTAIALWLRLNVPLILSVLYAVLPLQLALFVPFLHLGEQVFNLTPIPFSPEKLLHMVQTDWWDTLSLIGITNLAAVAVWLILSIPAGYFLYFLFLWILRKLKKTQRT